ncbi:two-component system response regulator CpxR [Legionella oakridgensis]|uniref:Response regulators consisting of a CheY-like receiver domain and a winged-helix DNA-binding domain protein n=2 Tax=Legionella oakridgensis TaxID=29423 RepID=W0BF73_9GAMM|nr:response regulator transcription factor [Legionella oakridgensis]AHE67321.1 response regulators consisting of a CheY-like receiver domain and a winged-helix DNA-binding domain protein [Legionella oakridgensis ATCC 33761 = DSM 21215]ETO93071.1 response regulator [Legionella oakridgensis RV-2-2007]KTD37893.1 transcriptional regulatory protein CpxR [Legionella oakridgensis]STY20385.1 transcriptional regulatory protein CpxR [Legionella longbeachae]
MNNKILIIDDDTELTDLLKQYMEPEGFLVNCVHDGETGVKKALNQPFDAIILDVMLPKLNGFEVLKTIREHLDTPVLMLTARGDDIDRIVGLEIGADDYLAKPCNPRELIARLRAILRRAQKHPVHRPLIEHGNIQVDCSKRTVSINGTLLELTNAEFNILEMLIKSPGQAFSKEELTEYALGRKYTAYDRSIDVHISNLRNKLGYNPEGDDWVKTVRGFGYLFNA